MNPNVFPIRPANKQAAIRVPSQDNHYLHRENIALEAENARLEAQIARLIEERDDAKRSNTRLKSRLQDAREGARRSSLTLQGSHDRKPRSLWTDVLVPMLELSLSGGIPGIMQVDIWRPSPPSSNAVMKEHRRYNIAENEPFYETQKTIAKGTRTPVLKISFFGQSEDIEEEKKFKREESSSKKRKL